MLSRSCFASLFFALFMMGALITEKAGAAPSGESQARQSVQGWPGQEPAPLGKWRTMTTAAASQRETGLTTISDVRVAPLLKSQWAENNYYTPSNYPCGSVATALAQFLRFHQHPTTGVGTGSFIITVNGSMRTATLRGGDGSGGPYAWASMPLVPDYWITPAQSQAIGALTYDAGISVNTDYFSGGAVADVLMAADSLKSVFHYSNAVKGYNYGADDIGGGLMAMINPNLDAGLPVLLGVQGSVGGRTIVCDGYGYSGSTLYHHLNLGWAGGGDGWYNLPTIIGGPIPFNAVEKAIYNIYTSGTGEIISGRVTTIGGVPVAGATVTAVRSGGGTYTETTNAQGIYALKKVPSNASYTISVASSGLSFVPRVVNTAKSSDLAATSGNVWGVDFQATVTVPWLEVTPNVKFSASGMRGGPFTPASQTYTIKNVGVGTLAWSATPLQTFAPGWVTLSKAGGSLAAGASDTLTVTINARANTLGVGTYFDKISFFNTSNGHGNTTRDVNLTVNDPQLWHLATSAAGWQGGMGHVTMTFKNKLWVLGGYNLKPYNEVWSSSDGTNWSRVAVAPWSPRFLHQAVVFNDRIYLMGGYSTTNGGRLNDVWSSADGVSWTRLTAAAPWAPRYGMGAVAFNNRLWILGGISTRTMNDVWSSPDGITWSQVTGAAAWPARYELCAAVFGGKMWIMGGNPTSSDVWSSSDGVTWTLATANAAWPARYEAALAVAGGQMWLMGGRGLLGWFNDAWVSSDGATWTMHPAAVPWSARAELGAAFFQNRLYITGGASSSETYRDVWYLPVDLTQPYLVVAPGTGLSATGSQGGPFTPSSATYTLRNTGQGTLNWTATKTYSWMSLSKSSGSLAPGTTATVTVSINANAKTLSIGSYRGIVAFNNTTNGQGNTTRDVSLTINVSSAWSPATVSASWGPRANSSALVFNDKIWVIGGYVPVPGTAIQGERNDVWNSSDGAHWTRVTAAAPWRPREYHSVVAFNGKMILMGGFGYADVWSSSDGVNWTRLTDYAPWGIRQQMGATVLNGKIWVVGGRTARAVGSQVVWEDHHDVWSSSDGAHWTQVTAAAPWTARRALRVDALNGRLVLTGGGMGSMNLSYNDVWSSSDGVNWRQETANAPWVARERHATAVLDNKLWLFGGLNATTNDYLNDTWFSSDGINWTQATAPGPWAPRLNHSAVAFHDSLYVMGGFSSNGETRSDVWYLPVTIPGAPRLEVTPATGLSATGAPGGPFTPASATYTLKNTGGSTLAWTAAKTFSWMSLSGSGGTLAPGASIQVAVSFSSAARALAAGTYRGIVAFSNTTNGLGNATRAVNLAIKDNYAWTQATSAAGWSGRTGHATVVFKNKLWILGGFHAFAPDNQVWSSSDGVNWTQAPTPPWRGRRDHQAVVFNGKIYVMGGLVDVPYHSLADVWSSADGVTWTQLTAAAPWGQRYGMRALVFLDRMWVIGGSATNMDRKMSDAWSSFDGVNWLQVQGAAPWARRRYLSGEVFGGKMWIMGGDGYHGYLNDVWNSSDGLHWTQVTAAAPWTPRTYAATGVAANKLWLLGGATGNACSNEVWTSSDGALWTRSTAAAPWAARAGMGAASFLDRLYITGGASTAAPYHDVWYMHPTAPVLTVTPETDFSATGGPGGPFTPASVTYTLKNAGQGTLSWTAAKTFSWMSLSKNSGSLAPGATETVIVSFSGAARALAAGTYQGIVAFSNTTNGQGNATRAVNLTVNAPGWRLAASAAPWSVRSMVCALAFKDQLWVLGGYQGSYYNDVWSSNDGLIWTQATAAAPWGARNGHAAAVLNGKLYLMGGFGNGTLYNDVWSTSDGSNWTRVTAAAPWAARWAPQAQVFNNKLWIIGGFNGTSYYNDVWCSSDGSNWTRVTGAAPWAARDLHGAAVFGGRMWIMGGFNGSNCVNDVWSSTDGILWTRATAGAAWAGRKDFATVAADDGKLWILGGNNGSGAFNDAWFTRDGANWTRYEGTVPWTARGGLACVAFQSRIYLMGGANSAVVYHDVWYLPVSKPAGMTVSPDGNFAASGLPGGSFTPASITYTLKNIQSTPLTWTAVKTYSWMNLSKSSGTLAPGATDTIVVSFSGVANTLAPGIYRGIVAFTNTTNGLGNATRTVSLTVNDPNGWKQATGTAPWKTGSDHATVVFKNKIWLIGGHGSTSTNEVWSSSDGINWNKAATPPWQGDYYHQAAVFNNRIFVMREYHSASNPTAAEIWSSADGNTWTQVTVQDPWSALIYGERIQVFNNKLWVFTMNMLLSSSDGATWDKVMDIYVAPWGWGGRTGYSVEVFGGKMWLMGGEDGLTKYNDVWCSSDGSYWTQVATRASWTGRTRATAVAFDNKLWLLGGLTANGATNEVWSTSDGTHWTRSAQISVPWSPRYGVGAAPFLNRLYLTGGISTPASSYNPVPDPYRDVWYLSPASPQP